MKVGVIGLGNIAQKAYLPSYVQLQQQTEFYFATRNPAVQEELKQKYGIQRMYHDLDELLAQGIEACFIHTATKSHVQLIKQCLNNGVHVFVDKPVSENADEVAELFALAQEKGKILMIGFNRRFAPMTQKLKQVKDKRMIYISKHRQAAEQEIEFVIYDLFLHVVDTGVFLLDEPILHTQSVLKHTDEMLETVTLILETAHTTAVLTMDLKSGANTEDFRVTSLCGTYDVKNLTTLQQYENGMMTQHEFSDWETTLSKRGFYQMVVAFLESLQTGDTSKLQQENVLLSHQLCQKLLVDHNSLKHADKG